MSGPRFPADYAAALAGYLRTPGESSLRSAYELGRQALVLERSVLDLAAAHHETLALALRSSKPEERERIARAAGDFFLEALSAFEMARRGFREAQEAALLERRQAAMVRRLSTLLGDASLAVDSSNSLEEMLQLVVEQARELTCARCSVARAAPGGELPTIEAASYPEDEPGWGHALASADLAAIASVAAESSRPVRLTCDEVALNPALRAVLAASGGALNGWIAVPLSALDRRELGSLHVLDKQEGGFTELDDAVLVHLAQMASAALERACLYQQ